MYAAIRTPQRVIHRTIIAQRRYSSIVCITREELN
ncbi:unnamed protein product [Ectocarpus sp. CCAP 1310/34]|nr:unnamed protein product [Ectocarpus sp. CCAP 1310/34]